MKKSVATPPNKPTEHVDMTPTEVEVRRAHEAKALEKEDERKANLYKEKRRQEYPPIGDQLDVVWKQFNQMRLDGTTLIQDADDMLGDILATKKRHKKPKN